MRTPQQNKKNNLGNVPYGLILVLILLGGGGFVGYKLLNPEEEIQVSKGAAFTVARGDLRISVIENGNLKAQNSENVECEVEGKATIVYIVPEGTYVKKGDLLVELDSADLEEKKTQQEIAFENAKADLTQAVNALKIQLNQNESDITQGKLAIEFAQMDLDKFTEEDGERDQLKETLKDDVKLAQMKLEKAKGTFDWTEKLHKKGFVTDNEHEQDKISVEQALLDVKKKEIAQTLALKYDHVKKERQLRSDLEEAKQELERIKSRADSQEAQKRATERSRQAQFKLQQDRFEKLQEQLKKCMIWAPQDGLVVYGSNQGDHRGRRDEQIVEEGAEVRYRQDLITLPDVSVMQVDTKVHESAVDKVEKGQSALITIDAYPDVIYKGEVSKVAILPDSQSRWLNPDLKVYSTEITMFQKNEKLKPGISAKVEIIVEELKDVIYVPIQTVFRRGGREVCYVADPVNGVKVRPVEVGFNNEQFVEIKSGLEQGEQVLLSQPAFLEAAEEDVLAKNDSTSPGKPELDQKKKLSRPEQESGENNRPNRMRGGSKEGRKGGMPDFRNMSEEERKKFMERMKNKRVRDVKNLPTFEEQKKAMEKMREEGILPQ